ncbi:MAG: hypothetical protein ACRC1J_03450 [Sandaracinobacteroides sp.]
MNNLGILVPLFALLIPIVAIIATTMRKMQERKLEIMDRQTAGLADAAEARIRKLEARVQVLERIATDGRIGLANEIDALEPRKRLEN